MRIRKFQSLVGHIAKAAAPLALLFLAARPASASVIPLCSETTLDNLVPVVSQEPPLSSTAGTTCDIGQFEYHFTGYLTKNGTTALPNLPGPLISDFTFIPFGTLGNLTTSGFTLTLNTPMSVTAPPGGAGQEFFQLFFTVTDIGAPGEVISTPNLTASTLSASGGGSTTASALAEINGLDVNAGCVLTATFATNCYRSDTVGPGNTSSIFNFGPNFSSGFGDVGVFLSASNGGTSSWDPSLTFSEPQAPSTTPEPATLLLLSTGLGLAALRRKWR